MANKIVAQKIGPCLWFGGNAEKAVQFYTGVFKNSKTGRVTHYGKSDDEHSLPEGTVLTMEFELDGQPFLALNAGPVFTFNEAVSFVVYCDDQEELDYYWEKLSAGGDEKAQICGWLKDQFGLSWQIVPRALADLMGGPKADKVMAAVMKMKKLDIKALEEAAAR
ncbi:Glyoxalase superfamily enzyme, possibly 3-demethylubiquinone-9 3-methyltransferase [Chitinophaga rupis]|uniref:Glyoxalase superfamily enzyme, possibly 3-demethylubiquinone-9 3-methyltransferase n=1 Tax=Chitinophaga rupis TaxID=573321 RepID=A0A1H7Y8M3_9BACT|nr:VOC family protein [Chitinophaga rupis]SEM42480.1 Glyoxalase superfamily enzyme, possibly 3-demethylubiquinone-9 3-methyltransferase [Chitinophaga rupis]